MKQLLLVSFVYTMFLPLFVGKARSWDVPLNIDVIRIKFYDSTGSTNTSLNIRKNYSTDIQVPEWDTTQNPDRNEPFAYIKSQSSRQVQVQLCNFEGEDVDSIRVYASVLSGTGFGDLGEKSVIFPGTSPDVTSYITFTSGGTVPSTVGKRSFTWKWYVTKVNNQVLGSNEDIGNTGTHIYYTVIATPQAPQSEPWSEALDYSCTWASGQSTASGSATEITKQIYGNVGGIYDTIDGTPSYTGDYPNAPLQLRNFIAAIPSVDSVNCYDTGKTVVAFGNAIGCDLKYQRSIPFGYVNCIKPIGQEWTNNPFHDSPSWNDSLIVGEDADDGDGRSKFTNHAFARDNAGNGNIFDACLKVDTDANPDAPLHTETWVTGQWNWDTYKGKVVDNNPPTETGSPQGATWIVQ